MASPSSVIVAIIFHLIFRGTVFVEYPDCHSNWTRVSSYIILASCILFLLDIEIFPTRYKQHIASFSFISLFVETTIALLFIEVFMLVIWMKLELFIVIFIRAILGDIKSFWTRKIVNAIVIMISVTFFIYAAFVTNRLDHIIFNFNLGLSKVKNFGNYLMTKSTSTFKTNLQQQNSQFRSGQCVIVPCERLGINPEMCINSQLPDADGDRLPIRRRQSVNRLRSARSRSSCRK
jgi:hypothetical protein